MPWLTASLHAWLASLPVSTLISSLKNGVATAASAGASYAIGIFSAAGPNTSMVTWPPKNASGPVSAGGKIAGRQAITINPADATARGIGSGDVVRVHNARGSCLAGAIISDTVSAGVVNLSCGAWYDPADGGEQALCLHGNANVLTRDQGTSKLGQGPSSATALVEVERYAEPLQPVAAFDPPPVVAV